METLNGLITWMQQKIDQIFGWFGFYSGQYSKFIVYAVMLIAASKVFKIKLNLGK